MGDYLIVGVTSESYDIERGKLNVRDSLLKGLRMYAVPVLQMRSSSRYQGQKLSDIIKYKVDLLVLGSDWRSKFDYLKITVMWCTWSVPRIFPAPSCAVREPLTPWV